jgi:hypothetical protein
MGADGSRKVPRELVLTLPGPQDGRAVLLQIGEAGAAEPRCHLELRRAAFGTRQA